MKLIIIEAWIDSNWTKWYMRRKQSSPNFNEERRKKDFAKHDNDNPFEILTQIQTCNETEVYHFKILYYCHP